MSVKVSVNVFINLLNHTNLSLATECSILLCEECQDDVSVCRKCTRGYEMKEARAVCTLIESRPALTSVEIIGIHTVHMHQYCINNYMYTHSNKYQ